MSKIQGCIFDLDGVIVDTAKYHFMAWKELADNLGITFTEVDNERMKGISRRDSLEILLGLGDVHLSDGDKEKYLVSKNDSYLNFVADMDQSEILPGVRELLHLLKEQKIKVALGSASKNARLILEKVGLTSQFEAIVDGNDVSKAKPDPEVFLIGAELLATQADKTVVWEDSAKGIDAALSGGFKTVGIGSPDYLGHAHRVVKNLIGIDMDYIHELAE